MNYIYLPTLKRITVKDFSLYSKVSEFEYDFINGVNLIVGGNGVGKTTFVNLIKYGLLGMYRKEVDVRVYKYRKIENRLQYNNEYFRNRMDPSYQRNTEARTVLTFNINNCQFEVTRSLYNLILEKVIITENGRSYSLEGKIIKQHDYQKLADDQKVDFLQYKYEQKIAHETNLASFDDFIFIINRILVFDETRRTVLWDLDLQERLSSKYFNDPKLDADFEKFKREAKYFDSLSRHKSEDIRAIKKVLDKIEEKGNDIRDLVSINKEINEKKQLIEKYERQRENIQKERVALGHKLKICTTNRNVIAKEIQDTEVKIKNIEKLLYKEVWEDLNPRYHIFLKNLKSNHICPLCNKELENELYERITNHEEDCMLCHKQIQRKDAETSEIKILKEELEKKLYMKQSYESDIYNYERELESFDLQYKKKNIEIVDLQTKVRDLEFFMQDRTPTNEGEAATYNIMLNEISKLEIEKREFQEHSSVAEQNAQHMLYEIQESNARINRELSSLFADFAESFLKVESYLTYADLDGEGKRFVPVIGGKERLSSDELSESQSFFIDHSFRMSISNYFYKNPSFFICETPESSLDISYEMNAADIFLKYLNKPNSLIITSNLNNSEFLEYIIDHANRINYINLLKIGKPSLIQNSNSKLIEISKRIEEKLNEKRKGSEN